MWKGKERETNREGKGREREVASRRGLWVTAGHGDGADSSDSGDVEKGKEKRDKGRNREREEWGEKRGCRLERRWRPQGDGRFWRGGRSERVILEKKFRIAVWVYEMIIFFHFVLELKN